MSDFAWKESDGVSWLAWEAHGVHAAFPARSGGVSAPPFDSLNLGLSVKDEPERVLENRRRLCAAVGVPQERLVVPGQIHGTSLRWVGEPEAGRGAFDSPSVIAEHDGLLTASMGLGLVISYADCVPVVIVALGDDGPLFATVHAGWRGMLAGIAGLAAAELRRRGRLVAAAVGPSIGPCCFAVDDELRRRFAARFPGSAGDATVDLWRCARLDLEQAGVPAGSVALAGLCTASDARFFSHRRDHGATGRHLAIAWREEAEGAPQK
ncbi:MAG TPA: polyphenol oxidase family protein [Thermoleophilia bacterium]|nr:polyphenol oxidase family protein [Thermoleophilia bacterium]